MAHIPGLGTEVQQSLTHALASSRHLTYVSLNPGDIVHARVFGQHIVVLNSVAAANDLLDKRSHIYSDRPYIPMMSMYVSVECPPALL